VVTERTDGHSDYVTTMMVMMMKDKRLVSKMEGKLIFQGTYRLFGTEIVECLNVSDVGCNLKQFDVEADRKCIFYFSFSAVNENADENEIHFSAGKNENESHLCLQYTGVTNRRTDGHRPMANTMLTHSVVHNDLAHKMQSVIGQLVTHYACECVCRETPSTGLTNAEWENVDHGDPVFPPQVQLMR